MPSASYELFGNTVPHRTRSHNPTARTILTDRGLPEHTTFTDTGCELADACLECPLALCKYDDPDIVRRGGKVMRDAEIMRLYNNGIKVSKIAATVNTSDRTVYRVIQRDRLRALTPTKNPSEHIKRQNRRFSPKRVDPNITSRQYHLYADVAAALA